eukprot:scaffold24718_cov170-Amphora_coffeaeformis.AAC.1
MDPRVQIYENSVPGTYRVESAAASRDAYIATAVSAFATADVLVTIHRDTCKSSGRDVSQTHLKACHSSHCSFFLFGRREMRWKGKKAKKNLTPTNLLERKGGRYENSGDKIRSL